MRPKGSGFFEWLFTRNTQKFRDKYGLPPIALPPATIHRRYSRSTPSTQNTRNDDGFFSWLGLAALFGGAAIANDMPTETPQPDVSPQPDPPSCDPL